MINVLIPNIGRRGYLVDYMKDIPCFEGKVFVSDCDRTASGLYGNNDGFFILSKPAADEKKYISELLEVCNKHEITLLSPVIDPEIYILSNYKKAFEEYGITVLVSDRVVLDICYNKLNMNEFLMERGYLVPLTYTDIESFKADLEAKKINFPIICKPVYGSGSENTKMIDNMELLKAYFHKGLMIQQYLDNFEEYGIDLFNTFEGMPVRCVIKRKISMRSGETDKSYTVKDEKLSLFMVRLASELKHIGNLDCDVLADGEKYYIIDLNPRFGGGYPATHASGTNLLELILRMINQEKIVPAFNSYKERVLVMKTISVVQTIWEDKNEIMY